MQAAKHPAELCLDFANTLTWHASAQPKETLFDYDDLIAWGRKSRILAADEAALLLRRARARADKGRKVFERGIELREAIYRILVAHLQGRVPAPEDLDRLNRELEIAHRHLKISPAGNGYRMIWSEKDYRLDRVLWAIARSAAELLTSPELLERVGQCADDRGCGWLFIDWSKNRSRRWCDINDCGNRAKQRRHYQRLRKQARRT